jgi:hypothetical protein
MKITDYSVQHELWDISYTHLKHLLPLKIKSLKEQTVDYRRSFRKIHHYPHVIKNIRWRQLEIKFIERELKYRNAYPEYRTFCELYVVGINEKTGLCNYHHRTVRQDESFLLAFAGWCEDHGMMVQSRKLIKMIDRIKGLEQQSGMKAPFSRL